MGCPGCGGSPLERQVPVRDIVRRRPVTAAEILRAVLLSDDGQPRDGVLRIPGYFWTDGTRTEDTPDMALYVIPASMLEV